MPAFRLYLLYFFFAPLALADTRVFVSQAGTLLEAEITAVAGDNVTLKRKSDQQTLIVNRKTLCKEDAAYIARWQEQQGIPSHLQRLRPLPPPALRHRRRYTASPARPCQPRATAALQTVIIGFSSTPITSTSATRR